MFHASSAVADDCREVACRLQRESRLYAVLRSIDSHKITSTDTPRFIPLRYSADVDAFRVVGWLHRRLAVDALYGDVTAVRTAAGLTGVVDGCRQVVIAVQFTPGQL